MKSEADPLSIRGLTSEDVWNYENAFYWFSHPSRINKLLAHFELYKQISGIPGDIFELGVYKATSLIRIASFRNLIENDFSRKIIGFDAFGKFPTTKLTLQSDLNFVELFENQGGDGITLNETNAIFTRKGFENISLVPGNVFDTLPKYLEEFPATRLALLHLDMDVKEPTKYALELLYDRVVPNGLIIFDDYNSVAGETDAVDEFIAKKKLRLEKLPFNAIPSYVRKPN